MTPAEVRADLAELLADWRDGTKTELDVLGAAETLETRLNQEGLGEVDYGADLNDRGDPRSVLWAIVGMLATLHHQGLTRTDVPALQAMLIESNTDPASAWMRWERHWSTIDWEARRRELAAQPFFAPFVETPFLDR